MGARLVADLVHPYITGRVRRGEIGVETARAARTALGQFAAVVGRRAVARLSQRDIQRWLEAIGHLSPGTRRNRWSIVHQFCDWLLKERFVRRHPMAGMRAPRVPRSVPRAMLAASVTATVNSCPDERAQLVTILMVQQGLRRIEIARLEMGDLDLAYGVMTVRGKGGHERSLPITAEARRALDAYLAVFPATAGPLIRSFTHPHQGVSAATIGRMVCAAMLDAGVKSRPRDGVSGHALRHTAATDMLRHGAHVRDVQKALGHAHLAATERYLPLVVGTLEQAMGGRSYAV